MPPKDKILKRFLSDASVSLPATVRIPYPACPPWGEMRWTTSTFYQPCLLQTRRTKAGQSPWEGYNSASYCGESGCAHWINHFNVPSQFRGGGGGGQRVRADGWQLSHVSGKMSDELLFHILFLRMFLDCSIVIGALPSDKNMVSFKMKGRIIWRSQLGGH